MKKLIITAVLIAVTTICSQAQQTTQTKNVGYWVVEGNIHAPKMNTIRFYNDKGKLIYEETIYTRINIKKKETQQALNLFCNRINEQKDTERKLLALSLNLKQ